MWSADLTGRLVAVEAEDDRPFALLLAAAGCAVWCDGIAVPSHWYDPATEAGRTLPIDGVDLWLSREPHGPCHLRRGGYMATLQRIAEPSIADLARRLDPGWLVPVLPGWSDGDLARAVCDARASGARSLPTLARRP